MNKLNFSLASWFNSPTSELHDRNNELHSRGLSKQAPNKSDFGFDLPAVAGVKKHSLPNSFSSCETIETCENWLLSAQDDRCDIYVRENILVNMRTQPPFARSAACTPSTITPENCPSNITGIPNHGRFTPPRSSSSESVNSGFQVASNYPPKYEPVEIESGKVKRNGKIRGRKDPGTNLPRRKKGRSRKVKRNEEEKRRISLEKNRLAAAVCREKKKAKIDEMERKSHDTANENKFLKQMIFTLKEDMHALQAMLLLHSAEDGCNKMEREEKAASRSRCTPDLDVASEDFGTLLGQAEEAYLNLTGLGSEAGGAPLQDGDLLDDAEECWHPPLPAFELIAELEI